jgi:hypothetical protein
LDDTLPQNTEGTAYTQLDTTITPANAGSRLRIDVTVSFFSSALQNAVACLFRDSGADTLGAGWVTITAAANSSIVTFTRIVAAGSTSATTFKIRIGRTGTGTIYTNDYTTPYLGGAIQSTMTVTEILP